MHTPNRANLAGLDDFDHSPVVIPRMNLYAHLCDTVILLGELLEESGFEDGVGERFFAIDVFFESESEGGGWGVSMVWGPDEDGVEAVGFVVEEVAEIGVGFFGFVFGGGGVEG